MMTTMILKHTATFASDIESICKEKKLDYIDAVVLWCESKQLDVEYAAALIKKEAVIKSKIQVEAENMNIIKRSAVLPL